jgi:CheY-like chemotaxis protein
MTPAARILVVDDDRAIRSTEAEILRSVGYSVTEAEDGEEALAELGEHEVEAIVMDVRMPRLDGISTVEHITPSPPPPGVLLVTAYDLDNETRTRLEPRVHTVLRKPVPPLMLIKAVEQAVDAARAPGSEPSGSA